MRKILSLSSCERGASVIELALTAPILTTMIIGMVDLSRAFSMKLQLEQAAQRTIEKVEQQRSVATDYSTLSTEAANAATDAGAMVSPSGNSSEVSSQSTLPSLRAMKPSRLAAM